MVKGPKLSNQCSSLTYQEQVEQNTIREKNMDKIEYKKEMHVPDSPPDTDETSADERLKTNINRSLFF